MTLYHYIRSSKSLTGAAASLFVHRNTVSYRIRRISELFGVDFADMHMMVQHYVSCLLVLGARQQ